MTKRHKEQQHNNSIRYATEGMSKEEYIRVRNGRNILELLQQGIPSSALVGSVLDVPVGKESVPQPVYPDGDINQARFEVVRVLDILKASIAAGSKDLRTVRHIDPNSHSYRAQLEVELSNGLVIYVRVVSNKQLLNAAFGELRSKWNTDGKLSGRLAREKLMILMFNEDETAEHTLRENFFKFAAYIVKKNEHRDIQYPNE